MLVAIGSHGGVKKLMSGSISLANIHYGVFIPKINQN